METLLTQSSPNKLRLMKAGSALGLTAILSGCAAGQYEILPNHIVEVIGEEQTQRYVTPQEGGYPHYEDIFRFMVQQCNRSDLPMADGDGCVNFNMTVTEQEFDEFDPGDKITFSSPRYGYPLNPNE